MSQAPQTLYDKIWDAHTVIVREDGFHLIYIDRHLIHEVTSPQAFEGLRAANRKVRKPELCLAVADHNVPTLHRAQGVSDPESREQLDALKTNTAEFGIEYYDLNDPRQGIVHIIGPEQGFTLPGTTIVCGDSHTSTHGAFGALAHGIGTSEVEHVLATQTLVQKKSKNMRITVNGELARGVGAKDIILAIIAKIGTAGATGCVIEYAGSTIENLSVEQRMTICNMSIEAGARAGLIAPDKKIFDYLRDRPKTLKGVAFDQASEYWNTLFTDPGAVFDKEVTLNAAEIAPIVTWGTVPDQALPVTASIPDPEKMTDRDQKSAALRALEYMALTPGQKITDIKIDKVFIGSCTNGRIEDMRQAAAIVKGKKIAAHIGAMVVPGSGLVKEAAEREGLDQIFISAGFEWREPGCSMCLAMNADKLAPGERCASTSNRNFEGRQGRGGRTHLMSPAMAAAAAIAGYIVDIRDFGNEKA